MDPSRFDALARSLTTRRRGVTVLAGAALAAFGLREVALACKGNGRGCDPKKAEQCCSGSCKKKHGKHRCRKVEGALGCTTRRSVCDAKPGGISCPNLPEGLEGYCFVTVAGKPYCGGEGDCFDCRNDRECDDQFGSTGLRCIRCAGCPGTGHRGCVEPPIGPARTGGVGP